MTWPVRGHPSMGGSRADILRETESGKWQVLSEEGKILGIYETREQAAERLRQIEAAKGAKGEKGDSQQWVRRVDYLGPVQVVADGDTVDEGTFAAHRTSEGYLRIDGHISSVGVYQYSDGDSTWGELRTAAEVFAQEALDSFKLKPVTDDHPSNMVTAENIKSVQKGHLGSDIRPDGSHVRSDILITCPDLITKIEGGKQQLSCGYEAIVTARDGVADDGTPYAAVQSKIRGNHLSVVDLARGGPSCRFLADATDGAFSIGDDTMKIVRNKDGTVTIEGTEYEVPDAVAAAIESMSAKLMAMEESEADQEEEKKKPEDEVKPDQTEEEEKKEGDALQAQIDSLKAQLQAERDAASSKIDARVALVTSARGILGDEAKTDGVKDIDLMRQVVAKVTPPMKSKMDKASEDYVRAAYEMALETHATKTDSSNELLAVTFDAVKTDDTDLDSLYQQHLDRMGGRVKSEGAN